MLPRYQWQLLTTAFLAGVLVLGCSQQPQSTPKAGPEKTEQAEKAAAITPAPTAGAPVQTSPETAAKTAATPTAAAAPKTAASPAAQRTEPKGKMTYAWHIAIAPVYFDPQENGAVITPYGFQYALHDALVKHMPGQVFAPSLAESYEIAPDFKSATFKLREGIRFHNGDPITPEDVKFTFESYRGANAKILKDKTERIEAPDARTVRFVFKEPFLDFQVLYGSPASGAGWIVPKNYYQQVGPDGFKQNPIGAGPYKLVRQVPGSEFELEAFTEYWRKAPNVKTLLLREVPEASTRLAMLQSGEADFINLVPGQLLDTVRQNPPLRLAPVRAGTFFLEFPGFEKPDNPFNKKQVREAVSLAIDRQAISDAEEGGLSHLTTNWIPEDWPGAIQGTKPEYNPAKAKQLMIEAGFPDGFDVESITPVPPYTSPAERIATNLREIGIRTKVATMDRAAFLAKLAEGPEAFKGLILNGSGAPGDAAGRIRAFAICKGASSRTCVPEIDEKFAQYEKSTDPRERERLLTEIQQYIMDNHIFVAAWRQAFISAIGPRIANSPEEIWGSVPQYVYVGPYEDVQLKE